MTDAGIIADLEGLTLNKSDCERITHPSVVGVILFARNYDNRQQLAELIQSVRETVNRPFLISVDQEGGRVQRLQSGFTRLPAPGLIDQLAQKADQDPLELACSVGWLMATELLQLNIDLSYSPLLDLNGDSTVIGQRAFSSDPDQVIALASAWMRGMHEAGMKTVAKHFPGHGTVSADSHYELPIDQRSFDQIQIDLKPFEQLHSECDAIMSAHVLYEAIDPKPASCSQHWLCDTLRHTMHYCGVVISDDLCMAGLDQYGSIEEKYRLATQAGSDCVLVCNNPAEVDKLLHLPLSVNERYTELLADFSQCDSTKTVSKHKQLQQQLQHWQDNRWY